MNYSTKQLRKQNRIINGPVFYREIGETEMHHNRLNLFQSFVCTSSDRLWQPQRGAMVHTVQETQRQRTMNQHSSVFRLKRHHKPIIEVIGLVLVPVSPSLSPFLSLSLSLSLPPSLSLSLSSSEPSRLSFCGAGC